MNWMHNPLLTMAMPEAVVTATALVILAVDVMGLRGAGRRARFAVAATIATVGAAAAGVVLHHGGMGCVLGGVLTATPLIHFVQAAILALTAVALWSAVDTPFTENAGEFALMTLLAAVGMMFLVATADVLVLFVALELVSLSLYLLAGFDKRSARSAEAGLKYFLFGGMSAGFLLFGFSLLYGLANTTRMTALATAVAGMGANPLLLVAMVMVVIGFGFKVAAAPLHFWAPDVYEGAPLPSAAVIASVSKVASFVAFYRVLTLALPAASGEAWRHGAPGWAVAVAAVAALSMLWGNLVAIAQTSVRRLLAYSAVGHAGYMLLGIVAHTNQSLQALVYYAVTYAVTTLGAFAVVAAVEQQTGGDTLADFEGLSRRSPVMAAGMMVFLLSLAGIPPLAGFFGKFYLFTAVLAMPERSLGLIWLVVLAVAMSAVSLYYYLQVLKRVYVVEPAASAGEMTVPLLRRVLVSVLALAVVALGAAPNVLLRFIVVQ